MRLSLADVSGFTKETETETRPRTGHRRVVPPAASSDLDDGSSAYMSIDMDISSPRRLFSAGEKDPYGWEAELDKRLQPGEDCCHQRAPSAKKTLLQRVLSLGPKEPSRFGM
ncbi:hypothetical protein N656DRAFT_795351 [Canariomyces notabilis]|jgi:hypothetical protein|uniref:Uncharacterized protein n=1 Tax=Canariomyces notabilis TaxID=2074819 RepID=A0AAN6TJI0_9PEZI|nr:hypothetical protein N656DRAFT_795351 [Canariomyces arenarius]